MDHLKIILTLLNLLAGTGIIAFLLTRQTYSPGFSGLSILAFHTTCYNLLLCMAVVDKYITINVPALRSLTEHPLYQRGSTLLFILLLGGMTWAVPAMKAELTENRYGFSGKRGRRLLRFGLVSVIVPGLLLYRIDDPVFLLVLETAGDILFLMEAVLLVFMLVSGFREQDCRRSRLLKSFAILYLLRYPGIVAIILVSRVYRFFPSMMVLFVFNVLPLIWVCGFLGSGIRKGSTKTLQKEEIAAYLGERGITARESEVVDYVLAGKSNREIEELLFISSHTVKNHIYSIYRKLEVKSRYDLIHTLHSIS